MKIKFIEHKIEKNATAETASERIFNLSVSQRCVCVCLCANKCIILHFARWSTHTACECVFVDDDNYETKNKNSYIKFSMCQRHKHHHRRNVLCVRSCVYVSVEETRGNHNKSNSNTVGWIDCCCCCLNILNIRPGVCCACILLFDANTHTHSQTLHTTPIRQQ